MIGRLAVVFALAGAMPAAAQTPSVDILTRYSFHLNAEHLSGTDPLFVWDANFGGELDLVDYGAGRATFVANYQAILGEQLRRFDPNQGNYILGASVSGRAAGVEIAGVFHHESRHLSDRVKRQPVDWNMAGARISTSRTGGRVRVDVRADVRGVVQKSFVDYRWEVDSEARSRVTLRDRLALVAAGGVRVIGVDGSRSRGTQNGFRGEAGLRVEGSGAAVELFVAGERRIDPYPLEFSTASWITTGFRLLSR